MERIQIIDSHTGGEPTRLVVGGGPNLGSGSMAERLERFRSEYDHVRRAVVLEPRGSDVLVGALLCEPQEPTSAAGVIFFNNVGFLGMCGHGTIGLVATLAYMGRISPGTHRIETPVGIVTVLLDASGRVALANVPSYRKAKGIVIEVPGYGHIAGDVAWGGNWFFLADSPGIELTLANVDALTACAWEIRQAINAGGFPEVDHIVLLGPAADPANHGRNFVLCPGKAYDRSPCGTGTSAKLACLYEDGKMRTGETWRQESILGSIFEGSVERVGEHLIPTIAGTAWVTAESTLILHDRDPFCWGIDPVPGTVEPVHHSNVER